MILITHPFKRKAFDTYNIIRTQMFEESIVLGYQSEEYSACRHNLVYGKVSHFTYSSVEDIVDY